MDHHDVAAFTPVLRRAEDLAIFDDAPLCTRCAASFAIDGDALCAECRYEIDAAFADLPGAEP